MNQKNVRKNGYSAHAELKAGDDQRVKTLLDQRIISVFTENKHFDLALLELDQDLFAKLFGKQITIFTKKRGKLPYRLQNSLLANAVDRRDKRYNIEHKRTLISLGISYQNTVNRIFVLITKTLLSRQKHKMIPYLTEVKKELEAKHRTTVKNGNIRDHRKNIELVEELIKLFS